MLNKLLLSRIKLKQNKFYLKSNFFCNDNNVSLNIKEDLLKEKQLKKELDNKDKEIYHEYKQNSKGYVYDKKPVKVKCRENKLYMWCSCGHSKNQPFCDGTHAIAHYKINLKPIPFKCKETKEYWFCNCKQTKNRPFCDGEHKKKYVQDSESFMKF